MNSYTLADARVCVTTIQLAIGRAACAKGPLRHEFFEFEAHLFWKRLASTVLKKGSLQKKASQCGYKKKAPARLAIARSACAK